MTSFTFFAISTPVTSQSSPSQLQCSIHIPTPPLTVTMAFTRWSPPRGHASSGTLAAAASVTEFHPLWLRNSPMAGCFSRASWSTHALVTRPRPCTRSRNSSPSNSVSTALSSLSTVVVLSTQRNRQLLASSPAAISLIWSWLTAQRLPNATYTTDRAGCSSSQATGEPDPSSFPPSSTEFCCDMSGPMAYTGGNPGTTLPSLRAASATGSKASNVFTRKPSALMISRPLAMNCLVKSLSR
uniref:Uncharacterized protein n=1 Tax=Zea mays TaxID=4577 RepID=A0A804PZ92_MAIZE